MRVVQWDVFESVLVRNRQSVAATNETREIMFGGFETVPNDVWIANVDDSLMLALVRVHVHGRAAVRFRIAFLMIELNKPILRNFGIQHSVNRAAGMRLDVGKTDVGIIRPRNVKRKFVTLDPRRNATTMF